MQVIHERCAAIDVHKKTAVTTVMITQPDGSVEQHTRTFATMTATLLALDDWLRTHNVKVIAMESTGVFWHPIVHLLEEGRTIILVNAQHMKALPGRKTDVKDSQWLADLLRHGLTASQFYPTQADPRAARVDPLSQDPRAGAHKGGSTACRNCWREPLASWRRWPPTCWARVDATCCKR